MAGASKVDTDGRERGRAFPAYARALVIVAGFDIYDLQRDGYGIVYSWDKPVVAYVVILPWLTFHD